MSRISSFRKSFRVNVSSYKIRNNSNINNADFSIMSGSSCELTSNHLESCRKILSRYLKKQKGHPTYKIIVKCRLPVTSKTKNSRMGKGKGEVTHYVVPIHPFESIFIVRGLSWLGINVVIQKMKHKLPIPLCVGVKKKTQLI